MRSGCTCSFNRPASLVASRSRLGRWIESTRTLEISRPLVLEQPWGIVVEVLKHEMAHQYVSEVLGERHETAHGPNFRPVVQRLLRHHHRPDPETPIEESMGALAHAVRSGKALYAGISNYGPDETRRAYEALKAEGVPLLIHQPSYSMFNRLPEEGLLDAIGELGIGSIVFSPLAQGLLTNRYLDGIPADSRAAEGRWINESTISDE
jgi:hypothetical protein